VRPETIFLVVWLIGVICTWPPWLWYSIQSRRRIGEPVFPKSPINADFCERRASGHARGKIAGATRCLLVVVANEQLWITPRSPFNLIAPYGAFGLEHRVPAKAVKVVKQSRGLMGDRVEISLPGDNGRAVFVTLWLKSPEAFLAALSQ